MMIINKNFINFIKNDFIENKNTHYFFIVLFIFLYAFFNYAIPFEEIGDFSIKDQLNPSYNQRFVYAIIFSIFNLTQSTYKVFIFLGISIFYINFVILIKIFFKNLNKKYLFILSLLLIVNPFLVYTLLWPITFTVTNLGILFCFYGFYLFKNTDSILSKYIVPSILIAFGIGCYEANYIGFFVIVFISYSYNYLYDQSKIGFKEYVIKNKGIIIIFILGLLSYLIIIKLWFIASGYELNHNSWRGEYIRVSSISMFLDRCLLVIKGYISKQPTFIFTMMIYYVFFLTYCLVKKKNYILTICFTIVGVISFVLPDFAKILINFSGSNMRLSPMYIAFAISIIIMISFIKNRFLNKVLLFVVIVYIILAINIIVRVSINNKNYDKFTELLFSTIYMDTLKANGDVTKINILAPSTRIVTSRNAYSNNQRDIAMDVNRKLKMNYISFKAYQYLRDFPGHSSYRGYPRMNVIYYNWVTDQELKKIIDDKKAKGQVFPKDGYLFMYKEKVYVMYHSGLD